jgi:uncharacterized protein GlcG (DUF336 family)
MTMTTMKTILLRPAAAMVLAALCGAATQAEGLLNTKRLSAAQAAEAVAGAVQACAQKNYFVGAVVVDYSGVQQAVLRGDGANPQSILSANDKAFTAATFGQDTDDIVARSRTGTVSSSFSKVPHLILASGGVVLKVDGAVIGAIGVSGAPGGSNDALCAKAGLEKIKDRMR